VPKRRPIRVLVLFAALASLSPLASAQEGEKLDASVSGTTGIAAPSQPTQDSIFNPDVALGTLPVEPPSWRSRAHVYLKQLVGGEALYETLPGAVLDQERNFPDQWGHGADAFRNRVLSEYGQFLLSESIEFGVTSFHREDPRYIRMGAGGPWRRTWHALKSTVVASDTKGGQTIALGRIAGAYGSWAIATRWNPPEERTAGQIMLYGNVNLLTKASVNLWREFWPDARRKLFRQQ